MKQYEVVIQVMEELGGVATLGQLYKKVPTKSGCAWATKTPFASMRRIVQTRKEIYKIKPGLYGLVSYKNANEQNGIIQETEGNRNSKELVENNHSYYQGLLLKIGEARGCETYAPAQDKNKPFLKNRIGDLATLRELPPFSYDWIVRRSKSVDVIWFNERKMPSRLFEVEFASDIQNSLVKFNDLQDFYADMTIVSDKLRKTEFERKVQFSSFQNIRKRTRFLDFESLIKQYEGIMIGFDSEVQL